MDLWGELVVCGRNLGNVRRVGVVEFICVGTHWRTAQAGDFGDGRGELEYGGLVGRHVIALSEPIIEGLGIHLNVFEVMTRD